MAANSNFFVYTNAEGVDVVVSHLSDVPPGHRSQVRVVDLSQPAIKMPRVEVARPAAVAAPPAAKPWHAPSFAVGAGAGLAVGIAIVLAFGRTTRIVSLLLGGLVAAGLALGYLSFARHQAGLPSVGLTTPAILLDDARQAAETMRRRNEEMERALGTEK